jgi:hypothetical protein
LEGWWGLKFEKSGRAGEINIKSGGNGRCAFVTEFLFLSRDIQHA